MNQLADANSVHLLQKTLEKGETAFLSVTSDSMAPLFRKGDQAQIVQQSANAITSGDIILIEDENGLLVHRFWGIIGNGSQIQMLTKGDRLPAFDPPSKPNQILGQVIGRRRNSRLLDLTSGKGLWLHRQLINLARLEIRIVARQTGQLTDTAVHQFTDRQNSHQVSLLRRINRRAIRLAAQLLTWFVDVSAGN